MIINDNQKSRRVFLYLIFFFLAFTIRTVVIFFTPSSITKDDISIYVSAGNLFLSGVNPYNHQEGIEIRKNLKQQSLHHVFTLQSQDSWNKFASSNLPLSTLLYGFCSFIGNGNPLAYRLIFALFDSFLCLTILFFYEEIWGEVNFKKLILVSLLVGVFSTLLISHGVVIPEDKGIQTFLMLASIISAFKRKFFLTCIFLGFSISFKGLGVFLIPLCLSFFIETKQNSYILNGKTILFLSITFIATFIFFIPYFPEVFEMMIERLESGTNDLPRHASIWTIIGLYFPQNWQLFRSSFVLFFIAINIVGVYRKEIELYTLTASILLLFINIILISGSLDRMNIGFLIVILLLGIKNRKEGYILTYYSILARTILVIITAYLKYNFKAICSPTLNMDSLHSGNFKELGTT